MIQDNRRIEQTPTLDAQVTDMMRDIGHLTVIDKGATLFTEGLPITEIPLIKEGRVRIFRSSTSGDEITLYEIAAGQTCVMAAASVLTGRPSPASAVAETPVSAWLVPADRFLQLFGTDVKLQRMSFDLLSGRLATVMNLVGEVAFQPIEARLAARLIRQADSANSVHETHAEIASHLGTAREVVSRIVKDMERRGIVELARGKIVITDRNRLSALAREGD